MSTTPQPLFDMSKAKPIFDMSKAQPINAPPQKKGFFQGEPFIGSTGEALAQGMKEEGSPEAIKGKFEGGMAGAGLLVPGEALTAAIATRSISPLIPLITSYLGAKFGYHVGKDVGGLIGEPEAGGTAGAVIGGAAGGLTGKTIGIKSLLLNLLKGGEEGESAAAASTAVPKLTPLSPTPATPAPAIVSTPTPTPEALHRFSNSEAIRKQILQLAGRE